MNKIPIKEISGELHTAKGFDSGPFSNCLACRCGEEAEGGACCSLGVNLDKESYDYIFQYRHFIEPELGEPIENCFDKEWLDDTEFLGGQGISTELKNDTCIFRTGKTPGCTIIGAVIRHNLPRRMIPSACRLYPITWSEGRMFLDDLRKNCVCGSDDNQTKRTIMESQKQEVEDIFELDITA